MRERGPTRTRQSLTQTLRVQRGQTTAGGERSSILYQVGSCEFQIRPVPIQFAIVCVWPSRSFT